MLKKQIRYSQAATRFYFDADYADFTDIIQPSTSVLVTDDHVYRAHPHLFKNRNVIVLKPGEQYKVQSTVDEVIHQLIAMEADRTFTLVGVGGGVVTDITGYVASVYMRGIRFGFMPTSLLAMVDASIGGKNGIDVGVYKNLVGVIRQPDFIIYNYRLLQSLPESEWRNGFAEIIKHAAIGDAAMFKQLKQQGWRAYRKDKKLLSALIQRNALFKARMVQQDEFEKDKRRLLNFGHTLGHALENQYELSHGEAIAIGMTYAARMSETITGFRHADALIQLLSAYELPTYARFDWQRVLDVLRLDKKRKQSDLHFVLLQRIGKAVMQPLSFDQISVLLQNITL